MDKLQGLKDQLNRIQEQIKELENSPKSIFGMEGKNGYFVDIDGNINPCSGISDKDIMSGLVFATEEEAIRQSESTKAIQRIKKYCYDNGIKVIPHNKQGVNWYVEYEVGTGSLTSNYCDDCDNSVMRMYFSSFDYCREIIDNCKEDIIIYFNDSLIQGI